MVIMIRSEKCYFFRKLKSWGRNQFYRVGLGASVRFTKTVVFENEGCNKNQCNWFTAYNYVAVAIKIKPQVLESYL